MALGDGYNFPQPRTACAVLHVDGPCPGYPHPVKAEIVEAKPHLWEVDHSYYCSDSNYHVGNFNGENYGRTDYDSWADFRDDWSGSDLDYNYLIRFDWKPADPDDERVSDTLCLYYMLQRKGLFLPVHVKVTEADEPEVPEFLRPHFEYAMALWEPFVAKT